MNYRAGILLMCGCLLLACGDDQADGPPASIFERGADAGSDTRGQPDAQNAPGFRLEGQLVPGAGLSISPSYTLSGHLAPSAVPAESESEHFKLRLTPVYSESSR